MSAAGARAHTGAAGVPPWLAPVGLSAVLAVALAVWDPQVRDLASHSYRTELFERSGLTLWNGAWFAGHYVLTYSVLLPPLTALLGDRLVGVASVIASAYLFDRVVRHRWGERARPATLWFAAGATTMLASGRLSFALGVALGLASLRAIQRRSVALALAAALACALANPVAAVFLAGVLLAQAASSELEARAGGWRPRARAAETRSRVAPAVALSALALIAFLYLIFPGSGQEPFALSAYVAVPAWCAAALYLTRGVEGERAFRLATVGYLVAATLIWLVPNAIGGNVTRLGALFGGPLLATIVLTRGTRAPALAVALTLAGSAYWQVQGAVRDVAQSVGDPATARAYYEPLARWLEAHDGKRARIEVPPTFNHWEAAYVAPDFQLARGWLRQADRERNEVFYEGRLTHERYLDWLRQNAVRYVALADAELDYSAEEERALIASAPPYLEPRAILSDWRVYEVVRDLPLVAPLGSPASAREAGEGEARPAAARVASLSPQAFELEVSRPGRLVARMRWTPYWRLERGDGCVGRAGDWTLVRADTPGPVRISIAFSPSRAGRALADASPRC